MIDTLLRLGYQASEYGVDQTDDGLVLAWRSGSGPTIEELLSEETQASLPPPVMRWTPAQFRDRFTNEELIAIKRATEQSDLIALLEVKLFTATEIVSNATSTVGGMLLLVSAGVLTQLRANEILGVVA